MTITLLLLVVVPLVVLLFVVQRRMQVSARFSALGLMNLSTLQENHRDIVAAKTYEPLIDLAEDQNASGTLWTVMGLFQKCVATQSLTPSRQSRLGVHPGIQIRQGSA